jgi:hypothetical protein
MNTTSNESILDQIAVIGVLVVTAVMSLYQIALLLQ